MKQQIAAAALAALLGSSYVTAQEMHRVVTGLDERNYSVALFDSKMPLKQVVPSIIATNFWITDTYSPSLLKDDPSGRPIGTAPPDNWTTGVSAARCRDRGQDAARNAAENTVQVFVEICCICN
jgi:hypothetical protein